MRMRKFYILSWGVMVLLFIVLACTLIKLYVEKETNLIETLKNGLEKNIDIYNQRTMNDTGNILSFSLLGSGYNQNLTDACQHQN